LIPNQRIRSKKLTEDAGVPPRPTWPCNHPISLWAVFGCSVEIDGKRAAAINSLIRSAAQRADPYAYLKDVLTRLPSQRASEIADLRPRNRVAN